jgi:hypothetical protein
MVADLLQLQPRQRDPILGTLTANDLAVLFAACRRELGSSYGIWQDDPVGWVHWVLGEPLWSIQQSIATSVEKNPRTAVPACHSASKTHLAGRLVGWWGSVWPEGTAQVVTTATKERQVKQLLWPHVRRVHAKAGLPGKADVMQWKGPTGFTIAYGFSPSDYDETAFSGIHWPHVLAVVDEAGGISPTLGGSLESLMSGLHARMLLIGNPPVDEELASPWFEERCNSPLYNVVRIPASATPNFTGEPTPACKTCPREVPAHPLADHVVSKQWVADAIRDHGADSRYVEARVHARFPKGGPTKAIPAGWLEDATTNTDHPASTWVRLGVDVAADGGDEFVIARAEGWRVRIVHTSKGEANTHSTDVAGVILREIREAEGLARQLGSTDPVRVKIDAIGLGWAIAGTLEAWGSEGLHAAEIVAVNVAERAVDPEKFINQRAEMWWNGRTLVQPQGPGVGGMLRLDVDARTIAQLGLPSAGYDSSGRLKIQPKAKLKEKGMHSPDRGEAVLLAVYEPELGTEAWDASELIQQARSR